MRLSFLLLAHKAPAQLERLLHAIYRPQHWYYVHVDRKATAETHATAKRLGALSNVTVLPSRRCVWAGFSVVAATLGGMRAALDRPWDYLINLSGQDYPIAPVEALERFLAANRGKNFIDAKNQEVEWRGALRRVHRYWIETPLRVLPVPLLRRQLPDGIVPYGGASWYMLSRDAVDYAARSQLGAKLERHYQLSVCPDEGYFQTVLMNGGFASTVDHDIRREIVFPVGASHPVTLTTQDLPRLEASTAFFARKFDEGDPVLDRLDALIATRCRASSS